MKQKHTRLSVISYMVFAFACFISAFSYIVWAPGAQYVDVVVRAAEKDLIWLDNGSPRIVSSDAIKAGAEEKDMFGRLVARVERVTSFRQPVVESSYAGKKTVYITVKLRARYNAKTGQYSYQGTTLDTGEWVRFAVRSVVINGLVLSRPGSTVGEYEYKTVNARLVSEGPFVYEPFSETTGVDRYTADAIHVGDEAKDSNGTVLAKVLEKTVIPASVITTDQYGNIYQKAHPRKVDVFLKIRVAVRKLGDEYMFLDTLPVKVNRPVPLFLPGIDIEPLITEVLSE